MINKIIEELKNPDEEFSPVPFWFLNDRLEETELKRQMEDFNDKGVNRVVLHPRIGIPNDFEYLSEEYFDIIKFIVKTAKDLDMRIVLYDEAMYPSGSAHGEVVKSNPDFASVGIKLTNNPSDGRLIAEFDDGYFIVSQKCGGTIRGIHYGEDDGEKNAPLSADILNPKAVEKFIELTHERYYAHLSEYFGNTIIGFFTDEPCILGRGAEGFFEWTEGLENDIVSFGGNLSELRALFNGEINETTKIYKQVITDRLNSVYYKKLSDWCESHNIALMGHPKESDDIDEEKYFSIPGQDLVFRWVSPERGSVDGVHSVQAKCSSDAARHMKKRRNSNECFGVCSRDGIPWYFTADDMKWYIDWLGVRGVNMFIPHAFYYSIDGKRKDERPPDVGPNNIWWKHYRIFSDYIKRVSYIMTDSVNCAKTVILCKSGDLKPEIAKEFYETQKEFNYLPYSLLNKAEVRNNCLCIGGYEYEYVIGDTELDVKIIKSADEVKNRDFCAETEVKNLRVSHIIKNGVHMYFIVNEGKDAIRTGIEMSEKGTPVAMDLWSGEYYGVNFSESGFGTRVDLSLKGHESILILFDKNGRKYEFAPKRTLIELQFKQTAENRENLTKTYTAEYIKSGKNENEYFEISCEEMAECYVNGKFAGVSFFNHGFNIGSYLSMDKNEITLVITGSIANKYSSSSIYYGFL
ncbi:MAG: hypothetical protein ACI4C7_08720 [Clostridia bacterium]